MKRRDEKWSDLEKYRFKLTNSNRISNNQIHTTNYLNKLQKKKEMKGKKPNMEKINIQIHTEKESEK